ncbi:MAG TPA: class I SAM-dependent methyltransferase [Planctomycetaceae bacterium]|nr:class I SAM-dependent methyltransferase [Planctomycetaceae bacterium]
MMDSQPDLQDLPDYRWNESDLAAGYDAEAVHIHPHYVELQETIVNLLPLDTGSDCLFVDAGGGSGRLAEKILRRFSRSRAVLVDQSAAFLKLARARLEPYGERAALVEARLQDDWSGQLPCTPAAIVSMSAIHHLAPEEKAAFYRRCHDALSPGGILMNGDEVRPADDVRYLAECRNWVAHMQRIIEAGLVSGPMSDALRKWEMRNVGQFGQPRQSGDDCHETVDAQLGYFRAAGFGAADAPWQKGLWALLRGVKCEATAARSV